jgi:hypothetical protein
VPGSDGSVDGVLRAAEGFARVGDRTAAEHALRTAERLVTGVGDPRALALIRAFAVQLPDVLGATPEAGR